MQQKLFCMRTAKEKKFIVEKILFITNLYNLLKKCIVNIWHEFAPHARGMEILVISGDGMQRFFYMGTLQKRYETDSPLWVRRIASASIIATSMHCKDTRIMLKHVGIRQPSLVVSLKTKI